MIDEEYEMTRRSIERKSQDDGMETINMETIVFHDAPRGTISLATTPKTATATAAVVTATATTAITPTRASQISSWKRAKSGDFSPSILTPPPPHEHDMSEYKHDIPIYTELVSVTVPLHEIMATPVKTVPTRTRARTSAEEENVLNIKPRTVAVTPREQQRHIHGQTSSQKAARRE